MSIRKYILTPKKLFLSSIILFLISCTNFLYTGTVELYLIETKDGKSIILLGDHHNLDDFQTTLDMADIIAEQEQCKKSITVLVEQALNNEHTVPFTASMLRSFSKYLEIYSLNKTVVKNIEIRTVSHAVLTLLNPDNDYLCHLSADSFFQNGSSPKIEVNTIIFQQVYDEYECLKQILSTQYQKYDDLRIRQLFDQQLDKIEKHYEQLQLLFNKWKDKYGIREDEAIVSLIKKIRQAEQLKLTKKIDEKKERVMLSEKLMGHIFRIFIPLFDINAFDHIMQQKMSSDIVLLVAGCLHTRAVKDWLVSCDEILVQSIVNNNSIDSHVTNSDMVAELRTILNAGNPVITSI